MNSISTQRETERLGHDEGEFLDALVDGGDWACAHALHGGLISVCLKLSDILDPARGARAELIADTVPVDLFAATSMWARLSRDLRRPSLAL
jgi:hypothetical protein